MKHRKYWSLGVLAVCITASLVFRRFSFVAWYPVGMSGFLALAFGLSLFTRPLCLTFAETLPPHLLPDGAERYCRRLTAIWCMVLALNGLVALGTVFAPRWAWFAWNCALSYGVMALMVFGEQWVRRRVFSVVFHTSGSTAKPKRIVKTFESLAAETVFHRDHTVAATLKGEPAKEVTVLATIEPGHMYGMLWRVLLEKAVAAKVDEEVILTPESLIAKMRAAKKVMLVTTPSFLKRFAAYADQYEVPPNCVEIVTSGALLTAEVSAAAKRVFGVSPLEIFGSTETGGVAWRRQDGNCPQPYDWQVFAPVKVRVNPEGCLTVDSPFSYQRGFTMGDGAELSPDARSFKLLGRRDRLVKIAEERVSLPEMEAKIAELDSVREAALVTLEGTHGTVLGAVLAVDVVKLAIPPEEITRGRMALAMRSRLLPIFPKGTVPRRYRFVRELPRNQQGKVKAAELRRIFESRFPEPVVLSEKREAAAWEAELVFPPDDLYFTGHFPNFPLLAGVVQLGTVQRLVRSLRGTGDVKSVKKMKFTGVICPGDVVRLRLDFRSEAETAYTYFKGVQVCASGIIENSRQTQGN